MPSESDQPEGGRVFFARSRRAPDRDAEIRLVSAGVDIGSSTSHLVFSRIVLQRRGNRTRVIRRELLHESDILLTPYAEDRSIDADALGRFISAQYTAAGITPDMIDTGALILTGAAAGRRNAAAVGTLFASQVGRFVAVAAGDGLETTLAAHGSGAVAASLQPGARVMNIDIGGGTSKIAVCVDGKIDDLTAIDVGARLICLDENGRVARIEPAGQSFADAAGVLLREGLAPPEGGLAAIAAVMAERLCEACGVLPLSDATRRLLRLPALKQTIPPTRLILSGGVAAYMAQSETPSFGDLGPLLANAVTARLPEIRVAESGIRATVIGASQHSLQLSGNTIFIEPDSVLPLANIPVIVPNLPQDGDPHDSITTALRMRDLTENPGPVALAYRWRGDATHARLESFCTGVIQAFAPLLSRGLPLVLVGDGDVGGLIGQHCRSLLRHANAVVSIDGITVGDCDFIDIGELLQVSGGVPVVVKSLVFPTSV